MVEKYDRTTYGGKTVDWYTRVALEAAAAELGYEDGLTIVQGSYNKGVGASAGTHDGGGAVDLAPFEADRKVRVLRKYGFAAWRRLPSEGPWNEHVHAVQVGNVMLSPAAANQVTAYRNGRNGLANNGPDTGPRQFVGTVFPWKNPTAVKPQRVVGVDISHHQTRTPVLPLARRYGVRFMYHKATEGATYRDPNYVERRQQVRAFNDSLSLTGKLLGRGIRFGAYHFARPEGGDAAAEAQAFLKYAQPVKGDVAPVLDLEVTGGLTMGALDSWASRFIRTLHRAGILDVGLYTPYNLPIAQEQAAFIWRPRYNNTNTPPALKWDVWQFSNGELGVPSAVPGFGSVDLNTLRKGFRVSNMRLRIAKKPAPEPVPEPTPEPEPPAQTSIRVGTRNVRGTRAKGFDDPADRATYAIREANERGIVVSALQELSTPQVERIESDAHPRWAIHAATPNIERKNGVNSGNGIMWRRDVFDVVSKGELIVDFDFTIPPDPYEIPARLHFPVVELREKTTGKSFRIIGCHYPAGQNDAIKRARGVCNNAIRLSIDGTPGVDVIVAGDFNGRSLRTLGSFIEFKVERIVSPTFTLTGKQVSAGWDDDGTVRKVSDHHGLSGEVTL